MPLTERNTNISRTGEGARARTVAEGKENSNTPKQKQKTPVKKTKTVVTAGITKNFPRRSRTQRRGRSQRRGRGRN